MSLTPQFEIVKELVKAALSNRHNPHRFPLLPPPSGISAKRFVGPGGHKSKQRGFDRQRVEQAAKRLKSKVQRGLNNKNDG